MQKKTVFTALGAFGFGALVSWAITADIAENQLIKERKLYDGYMLQKNEHIWILQQNIERAWASAAELGVPIPVLAVENPDQLSLDEESEYGTEFVEPEVVEPEVVEPEVPEEETEEETRSNLQDIIDSYVADPDQQALNGQVEKSIEIDRSPPFVISRDDYAYDEEGQHYSKITLQYYPDDRVILEDDENPMDVNDVPRMVGWKNLAQFGGVSGDPDVVFIRNRQLMTDFEVVRDTENPLPLHVKYGMEKEVFYSHKAAGTLRLRPEDE